MNLLVAEPVSPAALALMKSQEFLTVIESNPKEYLQHLPEADALLVRSAAKITADVLKQAPKLRVIGRAGVGVDNVDLDAATAAGVLVMNTPGGNAVSVAEHTVALMLSLARSVPQAGASMAAGKWEKKKFLGNELRGKTLGIVGLGSIGREVVKRTRNFDMRLIAYDPYVNPQRAADLDVALVDLPTLYAESDYITLHVAHTPETDKMLSSTAFAQMKNGVRIINCARGELVDGAALREAISSGKVAGAGLDVFHPEPPAADDPLLKLPEVIATPHIAGSTEEAQEIVGIQIVEQVVEYLKNGVAINAVNMPALSPEQYRQVGPYISLAERLGTFAAYVATGNPQAVRLIYRGALADSNTTLIRNAGLAGVVNRSLAYRANLVNALQISRQRGLSFSEQHERRGGSHMDTIRLELETDRGTTTVEGALVLEKPRLLQVDGIYCEAPLAGHIVYLKNVDVPGVIGHVGTVFGRNGVNIANFSLGRQDGGSANAPVHAVAVVETDAPVSDAVVAQLVENRAIQVVRNVAFAN